MATSIRLTTTVQARATSGPCCLCRDPARWWLRQRARCGLVVAALSCEAHEHDVRAALAAVTPEDVAAQVCPARRQQRAQAVRRRVARLRARATAHSRCSAALQGASSLTYTYAALAGDSSAQVAGLLRLAEVLEQGARL